MNHPLIYFAEDEIALDELIERFRRHDSDLLIRDGQVVIASDNPRDVAELTALVGDHYNTIQFLLRRRQEAAN